MKTRKIGLRKKESRVMRKIAKKNCCDCLHCKVSRKSIVRSGLCFCEQKPERKERKEKYWRGKEVCRLFDDMSA